MRSADAAGVLLCTLLMHLAGCGESDPLADAKYKIPVYPGAQFVERDTHSYSAGNDFNSLQGYDDILWTYRTADPPEKVIAFYEKMPEVKSLGAEDGETMLQFRPPKPISFTTFNIVVYKGKFVITQSTRRRR